MHSSDVGQFAIKSRAFKQSIAAVSWKPADTKMPEIRSGIVHRVLAYFGSSVSLQLVF